MESGEKFAFIGFNAADDRRIALDFLKEKKLDYPTVLDDSDAADVVTYSYNLSGYPLHYIIDGEGKIVHGQYGSDKGFPRLRKVLKDLGVE
jgi:hypothetical protein